MKQLFFRLSIAGEQDTAAADGTEQKLYIDHVTIHPEYDWKTKKVDTKYDIAVIKLKTSVEWTNYVRPICLPGLLSIVYLPTLSQKMIHPATTETSMKPAICKMDF